VLKKNQNIADAVAKFFGIDIAAVANGWGCAMDALYDGLAEV
jgi:hypothetical protein